MSLIDNVFVWLRVICLIGLAQIISIDLTGQIVNIEDVRADFTDSIAWYEQADLDVNLADNGERVFIIKATAQFEFQLKNRRFLSLTKYHLINAGETEFVNNGFQHIRINSLINDWLEHEVFGQIQYNERINLKVRGLVGTGFRVTFVNKKNHEATSGISYMYEYDEVKGGVEISRDSRLSSYLSYHLHINDMVKLSNTTYYQPLFRNVNDFRLASETLLEFKFSEKVSFKSSFEILYDSRQAIGAQETIYTFNNGIRYRFK